MLLPFTSIDDIRRAAHALVGLGYHLVPLGPGGKRPLVAWKDSPSGPGAIDRWLEQFGCINLAIHAGKSGIVVFDADTPAAERWIIEHGPLTPMRARTPRGGLHAYYRAPEVVPPPRTNVQGIGLDVRSGRSLIVASPSWSRNTGNGWAWTAPPVPPSELPVMPAALIRAEPVAEPETRTIVPHRAAAGPIRDVTRWVMAVESVQGQWGSNQCFKVACRLVDAGLPWEEAWRWLCHWNESGRAIPPWSEAELRHKLRDAFARGTLERRT